LQIIPEIQSLVEIHPVAYMHILPEFVTGLFDGVEGRIRGAIDRDVETIARGLVDEINALDGLGVVTLEGAKDVEDEEGGRKCTQFSCK
jgi:hypothetical protein